MTAASPPLSARFAAIVHLAEEHEERLLAIVQKNDCIFLDPAKVGSLKSPLATQLVHYLASSGLKDDAITDFEVALRTGVIAGAAEGDADDDSDTELLAECWRERPCDAWAAALRCAAAHADVGGVVTPFGDCIGPLPIEQWAAQHLPPALEAIEEAMADGTAPLVASRWLVNGLVSLVQRELRGRSKAGALRVALPRLMLCLHFWTEQVLAAANALPAEDDPAERDRALECAAAAAAALLSFAPPHGAPPSATAAETSDVTCLAFVASLLCEQESEIARRHALYEATLPELATLGDDDVWYGDGDEPTPACRVLRLAIAAVEEEGY